MADGVAIVFRSFFLVKCLISRPVEHIFSHGLNQTIFQYGRSGFQGCSRPHLIWKEDGSELDGSFQILDF